MILLLPAELLSLIFENLTNERDQLSTQLVCYSWHGPAKRAFYKKVAIQEVHSDDNNHQNKLTQFIQSMTCSSVYGISNGRIPSAGQYVKSLLIDFELVLEPNFMPTVADYQLLATATPNLEEFDFPVSMFWNCFISANLNQYWTKLKRLPSFRLTLTTPTYQLDRFLFFHISLTTLEIQYVYSGRPQQLIEFTQMIRLFTNLEVIKITSNTLFLNQMIPILATACPRTTKLVMITPGANLTIATADDGTNNAQSLPLIPKLRHLDLNVHLITPQLIRIITQNFPDLRKLVLQHQQKKNVSAGDREHLIHFITTRLSQSSIQLFLSTNEIITLSKRFLMPASLTDEVAVHMTYDSRSSCTTNTPDLSYQHQQNSKDLYVRFQGPISAQVQHQHLPHMQLLKTHGTLIGNLKIQLPLCLYQAEMKNNFTEEEMSCVQTVLMYHCPNLSKLHATQCYFDIKENFSGVTQQRSHLNKLTLEKSKITSASLYHISQQCIHLNYLVLDQCEFGGIIDMPRTVFKNLSIISNTADAAKGEEDDTAITIFEHHDNRTTQYHYSSWSRKIILGDNKQEGTLQNKIKIKCWSMDQFRFNHIPIN